MPRTRTDVGKLALVPNDEMCLRWSECVAGEYGGGLERSVCPRTAPRSAVHGIRLYETCDVAHGAWHSAQRDRRPVRSQADFDKFSRAARAGKFLIKFSKILTWAKWWELLPSGDSSNSPVPYPNPTRWDNSDNSVA